MGTIPSSSPQPPLPLLAVAEQDEAPEALRQGVYIPFDRSGQGAYVHNSEQIDGLGSAGEEEGGGQDRLGGGAFGKGGDGPPHELGLNQGLLEAVPLLDPGVDAEGGQEAAGRQIRLTLMVMSSCGEFVQGECVRVRGYFSGQYVTDKNLTIISLFLLRRD